MTPDQVLAHYGGADELGLTLGLPALIFGGFLLLEKRARRREREAGEAQPGDDVAGAGT